MLWGYGRLSSEIEGTCLAAGCRRSLKSFRHQAATQEAPSSELFLGRGTTLCSTVELNQGYLRK